MNDHDPPKILPLGESALVVEFGRIISKELNEKAIALADLLDQNRFDGYIESLPAYASTTVYFDSCLVRKSFPRFTSSSEAVRSLVESLIPKLETSSTRPGRSVEIPAAFGADAGPDLENIATAAGVSSGAVVEIFTSATYRVYMLGFLPGFAYMGEVDKRIASPRRSSPRLSVPAGSIGIAGRQTGIYSIESPGGWQIIGRTDLRLFNPDSDRPSLLRAGDVVKFVRSDNS
jgi:inhibitor of KinA